MYLVGTFQILLFLSRIGIKTLKKFTCNNCIPGLV